LIYPAEGDAKKAMALAVSSGLPNRPAGIELFIVSDTTSTEIFPALDFASINEDNRSVSVKPGRILFEVEGISREEAEEGFRRAGHKLPIKTKFAVRRES